MLMLPFMRSKMSQNVIFECSFSSKTDIFEILASKLNRIEEFYMKISCVVRNLIQQLTPCQNQYSKTEGLQFLNSKSDTK